MVRRDVSILCVHETKWVVKKLELQSWGYKLWYTGRDRDRNGVGVIINKQLLENMVEIRRKGDKILLVKLILGREIFNIISIYAPQVGLDESSKRQFQEDLDEMCKAYPLEEIFSQAVTSMGMQELVVMSLIVYMEDLSLIHI